VKYAIDCVAGKVGTQLVKALGIRGQLKAYGRLSAEPVEIEYGQLLYKVIEEKRGEAKRGRDERKERGRDEKKRRKEEERRRGQLLAYGRLSAEPVEIDYGQWLYK
jgi:hypothetical protein